MPRPRVGLQHPDADPSCESCRGFGTVIVGCRAKFCACTVTTPAPVVPDPDAAVVVGSSVIDSRRGPAVAQVVAIIGDRALLTSGSNPRVADLVAVA